MNWFLVKREGFIQLHCKDSTNQNCFPYFDSSRVQSDFSFFLWKSDLKHVFNRKQSSILSSFTRCRFQSQKVHFCFCCCVQSEDNFMDFQISKNMHESNRKNEWSKSVCCKKRKIANRINKRKKIRTRSISARFLIESKEIFVYNQREKIDFWVNSLVFVFDVDLRG